MHADLRPRHEPRPSQSWQAPPVHCAECGAKIHPDPELEGQARCASCRHLFELDVEHLPRTALSGWGRAEPSSQGGEPSSALCPAWLDRRTGDVHPRMLRQLSHQAEAALVACLRDLHEDDAHEWDIPGHRSKTA